MNPIRLSKDWAIITQMAIRRGLKSNKPEEIQKFVDELVDGVEQKKATIFIELIEYLSTRETLLGTEKRVYSVIKPNGNIKQSRRPKGNV